MQARFAGPVLAHLTGVLTKGHIQRPVQFILHRPVAANGFGDTLGARAQGQTADVVMRLLAGFLPYLACGAPWR